MKNCCCTCGDGCTCEKLTKSRAIFHLKEIAGENSLQGCLTMGNSWFNGRLSMNEDFQFISFNFLLWRAWG